MEESNMSVLLVILGVLMVVGGFSFLFSPPLATMLAAGYIVGILMLVYGIATLVRAITDKEHFLIWIMSILSIVVGIISIVNPGGTLTLTTVILYLLAADFLIQGILQIILSIQTRDGNRTWVLELITGILSTALGVFAFINPTVSVVALELMFTFFFVSRGLSLMTLGMMGAAD